MRHVSIDFLPLRLSLTTTLAATEIRRETKMDDVRTTTTTSIVMATEDMFTIMIAWIDGNC